MDTPEEQNQRMELWKFTGIQEFTLSWTYMGPGIAMPGILATLNTCAENVS